MLLHVCSAVCLVLLTALTYRKAPSCGFVFDDHLAVVNNDDTNPTSPWSAILLHDFWGKPLRQADSNKSFRPVSTASFRLNRMWAGLAPSSFHCVNIALHTAVVLLVYRIAFERSARVSHCRSRSSTPARAKVHPKPREPHDTKSRPGQTSPRSVPDGGEGGPGRTTSDATCATAEGRSPAELSAEGVQPAEQPVDALRYFAAIISAALFAVHPVHVEAVTGVVGRAELLSCIFFCTAFILFSQREQPSALCCLGFVLASLAAAFAKETGITIVAVVIVDDVLSHRAFCLHVPAKDKHSKQVQAPPFGSPSSSRSAQAIGYWPNRDREAPQGGNPSTQPSHQALAEGQQPHITQSSVLNKTPCILTDGESDLPRTSPPPHSSLLSSSSLLAQQLAGSRKLWVSLFVVAAYFLIRLSAIGSLDLSGSRLLRKTENPLLFAESWSTRFRSSVVIQGHYLRLLTAPSALCCEYPAFCIPLSAGWGDIRFWGCTLVFFSLCWAITQACCSAKWRPVAASSLWAVISFIPATGIFLTIGTMIAERLLYTPSVGFCVAVGLGTVATFEEALSGAGELSAPVPCAGTRTRAAEEAGQAPESLCGRCIWRAPGLGLSALLCVWVAHWSYMVDARNNDWYSDETLFESALRVCPEGAKHHQQFAILQLNRNRPVTALRHLRRAQEIDSEWCEPALYIGKSVALLDGKPPTSTRLLEARMWWKTCVACPFVAGECFELFSAVQEGLIATGNTTAQHELGDVLHAMHEYRLGLAAYRQAGLQRFNAEDWEGAADSFRRAIGSWSVTEEDGLASNTISNTDAKKKKKMKQTKNTANSAPKGSSPDELQHPCNIFYWLAQAELNMLRHRSALEVYRRQFIECSQRQRAVNAAFEGIIQILQEAGRSPHILHRLHVSPAEALELQADVLLKASHNPLIASRSDTADALLQSAAELFAKLADRGDSDNGSDGKLCAFADKAVEAAGRRSLNSHDATFCRALLLQGTHCAMETALQACTANCSQSYRKKCSARQKTKKS
ncbi:Transmembrane and TPR repeat-containing protein [Diplonema papillatum]|nr:Transmembrane and TPR repeat-containing protein [Diplonema papillatum]